MRKIGAADIDDLARGAAVPGAGGGGDPYIGGQLAQRAIAGRGPVSLVAAGEVPADALVIPVGMMGAPTVILEKLLAGTELVAALRRLEASLGEPARYLTSIEAGGINSTTPFAAAAETGLPVVDADCMGRAFPELQMTMPGLAGISASPMTVADEKDNTIVLHATSNHWAESLARAVTVDMGGSAAIAFYPMRGNQLPGAMVTGTLSLAQRLGRRIRETAAAHAGVPEVITAIIGGKTLARGKVIDIERRVSGGFIRGQVTLEATAPGSPGTFTVAFQNEYIVMRHGETIIASVPDLICLVEEDTGEPVTAETIQYGLRATAIGMPCDPRWRTPEGLSIAGPACFGYNHPYTPL